ESGVRIHSVQRESKREDLVPGADGSAAGGAGDGEEHAQLPHAGDRDGPDLLRGGGLGGVHEVREGED
ncbi:hypothetical protein LINGRAHAP2_LOCUS25753, partial [Linum grandiflorum]